MDKSSIQDTESGMFSRRDDEALDVKVIGNRIEKSHERCEIKVNWLGWP
jgi:hypothetical protein